MNKAFLYQNSNGLHRYDAQQVLNEFQRVWKWRSDGRDTMLDVGCGSGDITMDIVLPILPEKFERLVGCDLSDDMVNYARDKHFHPRTSFEQFDLSVDLETQSTLKKESFDHITSFYCLMWVHNQKTAIKNLYKLLKPGGDLLVAFVAQHPIYDFYKQQSRDIRWAQYMTDVDEFCSPYQHSQDPAEDFHECLLDSGFTDCIVQAREKCYKFNGVPLVRNLLKSTNPFIDRIPNQEKGNYIEDLMLHFVENDLVIGDFYSESDKCCFAPPYKLMVAYASK